MMSPRLCVKSRGGGPPPPAAAGRDDVILVSEVADRSVEHDRTVKLPRYAAAGIVEAWRVDLPARQVEVYRHPHAGTYTHRRTLGVDATLTVLGLPGVALSAAAVLG